ncbi:phosphoribosylglycinamide formyltransferase [Morganella morganii]|uniref:phosphoribosylglycinamide formyltransferase n=1 Tax=Morganella morganii TaxID=582 RepID=UPI0005389DF8|nr:phosphoribosylglycinamide formyltransferase [Morganella morganii]AUU01601.1 phosphoribosylglycinamide formyltransferase [Morganella morganii]AVD59736.1 phosphoribosylglycinamide formyltransferase [Morganella morganii]EHZ6678454.1 phosphoribosylglycinamide formyltransferase [Morganella morganii]EKU8061466.1 phosphoribosylglycinamide formyltransferase [Morganella morganii]EKW8499352.1 phosphoribosylglycinamide formyltransferase [Morganella morganii]
MKKRLVVLISGSGSNLQALIDACDSKALNAEIVAVFSNKAGAYGLLRAQQTGIPALSLSPAEFSSRDAFDAALQVQIDEYQPDLIILAGYMRILTPAFVRHYHGKMLNIHPSLLPKYPGLHTHRKALENGDAEHGTSVHFVTEELDGGPVILQARIAVLPDDTEDTLTARIQQEEHRIYPQVVNWFVQGRLVLKEDGIYLDGKLYSHNTL